MRGEMVGRECVVPEFAAKLTPDRVRVVRAVLRVVVFDQEVRAVDHIIVRFHRFIAADPCKIDFAHPAGMEFGQVFFSFIPFQIADVFLDQIVKNFLLALVEFRSFDSLKLLEPLRSVRTGDDVSRDFSFECGLGFLAFIQRVDVVVVDDMIVVVAVRVGVGV